MTNLPAPVEEISVSAKLDEVGVSASVRSRAASAFDRFLGSAIDIPTRYFESIKQKLDARADVQEKLIRAEGEAALEKLREDATFGDRVIDVFHKEHLTKLQNRDAIARKTIEFLPCTPVTEDENSGKSEINPDWMNAFTSLSELASTEDLRELWARVLAGEIVKPGTFSRSTLRVISEIDRAIAAAFEEVCLQYQFKNFLIKPTLSGDTIEKFMLLEAAGLIQGTDGFTNITSNVNPDGYIYLSGIFYMLKMTGTTNKIAVNVVGLTRPGIDISGAIMKYDDERELKIISNIIFPKIDRAVLSAAVHKILVHDKGAWIVDPEPLEVLKG